jgi:uncharacterized protein YjbI with pentapeptide repeats
MINKKFKIRSKRKNSEEKIRLKICHKRFLNEPILNQYNLSLTNFIDCRFEKIEFSGRVINSCKFKNSEFNNCIFENC